MGEGIFVARKYVNTASAQFAAAAHSQSKGHRIHANVIAFFPREPRLKEVPLRITRRSLDVHAFRDGPLRNR